MTKISLQRSVLVLMMATFGCAAKPSPLARVGQAGGKADQTGSGQVMNDPGSAKLAAMLAGHQLACVPSDGGDGSEEAGFFPFAVTAMDQGDGTTLLDVQTAKPEVGFGFGGVGYDPVEVTPGWTILAQGDDGRRYLFVNNFTAQDTCSGTGDAISGDIVGIVSEVWDAGTISSRGVQCCVR